MKRTFAVFLCSSLVAICLAAITYQVFSQTEKSNDAPKSVDEIQPTNVQASKVTVSAPVSSFAPAVPETGKTSRHLEKQKGQDAREIKNKERIRKEAPDAVHDADAAALLQPLSEQMPAPALTFEGLSSEDNASAYGFRAIPPDTTGDVGLNHYVQAVNLLIRVFDKQGNALTPPFKPSSLYAPLGTPCSRRDDGDPIVLYDGLADRWLISTFCTAAPPFRQMIAVSQTGDPLGSYFVYEFVMPNVKFNDYPKFGVWHNAYYMTTDQFLGSDYAGTGAFAFNREKLLSGDATANFIYFDLNSPSTNRLGGMLPADLDGLQPPPVNAGNIFASHTATEYGEAADSIKLFEFRPNFGDPGASTFSERPESPIAVAAFDPTSPPERTDIRQPAPGDFLDSQSDRLMYRLAYRNFGTHESLVVNQTVRVSSQSEPYRAGVRFYELQKNAPNAAFFVKNQATAAFDDLSRWMGSAAQDNQGNVAIGYSTSSGEKIPSISYTGRLATDAPNSLRGEQTLFQGTGVQTAFGFRWGDYSTMSVDPANDCVFWYTNEYYSLQSQEESPFGWLTRIGTFKFPTCTNAPRATIQGAVTNAATGQPISGAIIKTTFGYSRATSANGNFNFSVLPNAYTLTVSAPGFRSQTFSVNVANGETATQNFALQPTAVLQNAGADIAAESCTRNNAIEPGETVTINLPLKNTGAAATTNLTATLLPAGGVTNPSQPQVYGALQVNETAVRPFTFTASPNLPCGETLTLTFELQDSGENLGIVTRNFNAGARKIALSENFSAPATPNLPAGWTTSGSGAQQPWQSILVEPLQNDYASFSPEAVQPGVNELVSPVFRVASPQAQLTFRNKYNLETTFLRNKLYDGGVLEIRYNRGVWRDILAAGGSFVAGGYDGVLESCCQNPLGGRMAWSGKSGSGLDAAFINTQVNLPRSAVGKKVQLRWRVGTDIGTTREGQWIDDVEIMDGYVCSCGGNALIQPEK